MNQYFRIIHLQLFPLAVAIASISVLNACKANEDTVGQSGIKNCQLEGWVSTTMLSGVNVYNFPNIGSQVIGVLPPLVTNEEEREYGVELEITGSVDGWLRIENARDDPGRSGLPPRLTFGGEGWLVAEHVSFNVQSDSGYSEPLSSSEKILDLEGDWLTDRGRVNRVTACNGTWALVEYSLRYAKGFKKMSEEEQKASVGMAWFTNICANQETTCDM